MGKYKQLDAEQMKALAQIIKENTPDGLGFALLTFDFGDVDSPANYVANANREDMIKHLRATADRLENKQIIPTFDRSKKVICIDCNEEYQDSLELRSVGCPMCGGILMDMS